MRTHATARDGLRFPPWMRKKLFAGGKIRNVERVLKDLKLCTVCVSAQCPNRLECFCRGTATFMILGERCTRDCRFCAIGGGEVAPPREDEPAAVAKAAEELGLRHVVITSVTRDDLSDGGAAQFVRTVEAVRERLPRATLEVLTPDFLGDPVSIEAVLASRPDVFNHNVETVARLYSEVRPQASYRRSLGVLGHARYCAPGSGARPLVKSGLMVGLGESDAEVEQVLLDLRAVGVDAVTIGQYLAPSPDHVPIARFVSPEQFAEWESAARQMGFDAVWSGPYVRSSYNAEKLFHTGAI